MILYCRQITTCLLLPECKVIVVRKQDQDSLQSALSEKLPPGEFNGEVYEQYTE